MNTKKNINAMERGQKDRVYALLKKTIKLRKEQLASIEDGIVKPLRENMELAKRVLRGEDTLEHFMFNNVRLHQRIEKIFKIGD